MFIFLVHWPEWEDHFLYYDHDFDVRLLPPFQEVGSFTEPNELLQEYQVFYGYLVYIFHDLLDFF